MKSTIISILVATALIGGVVMLTHGGSTTDASVVAHNVNVVDGKQIIEIRAKGGYQSQKSVARVGIPTVLRFVTNGTFDCSSSVRIPSLGISKILPQTGVTDIEVGVTQPGTLQGICGMGMYPFEIEFQG